MMQSAPTFEKVELIAVQTEDEHGCIRSRLFDTAAALRELRAARATFVDSANELRVRFARLTEWVRIHFASEEERGLFDALREGLPGATEELEQLQREHHHMRAMLDEAREALEAVQAPNLERLIGSLNAFTELLARHEAKEDLLTRRLMNAAPKGEGRAEGAAELRERPS